MTSTIQSNVNMKLKESREHPWEWFMSYKTMDEVEKYLVSCI
jgi:hypothetical protein